MKIFDCITFFQENFVTNMRFEILKNVVDKFVICESLFDHKGIKKDINFKLLNSKYSEKIFHLILDHPFPKDKISPWDKQAYQREYLFDGIKDAEDNDLIMFSDPDEIPNPNILKNFSLKSKYAIFLQKCFNYKINLLNTSETPWEGTRIVKKKNLKSFNYLRQFILEKNIKKWWRFDLEKDIQIIENGGWHFNNLLSPEQISLKLKTFAHDEYNKDEFTNIEIIKEKIKLKKDLFNRNNLLKKIIIDKDYPDEILNNINKYKNFIL